jgi:hypothetical protein
LVSLLSELVHAATSAAEGIDDDLVNVMRGFESRWGCSILFVFFTNDGTETL